MDKRIHEGLDACRPASEDLHDAELADVARCVQNDPQARLVYDRLQEYDAAILKSIDDVSVPPGLSERILERLRAAQEESNGHSQELLADAVAVSTAYEATPEAHVSPAPRRLALSRRHVTGAALTALLACVLLVVVINLLQDPSEMRFEELAVQWQAELGSGGWQPVAKAPDDFAVPGGVTVQPSRWQWVNRLSTTPVVAYQLQTPKGAQAMLFVARMSRDGVPSAPPIRPQWASGKAVAYWQSGSRVFVLVVEDEGNYRDFVRTSTAPFA